jgi:bacterioferritin-associated ferredoxin
MARRYAARDALPLELPDAISKMNDNVSDVRKDIICRCSGTTEMQIKRLVDKGVIDLDGISRASGAGSGCGSCDYEILELVAACTDRVSRGIR